MNTINELKKWLEKDPMLMGYTKKTLYFVTMEGNQFTGFHGIIGENDEQIEGELIKKTSNDLSICKTDEGEWGATKRFNEQLMGKIIYKYKFTPYEMQRFHPIIDDIMHYRSQINEGDEIKKWYKKYKVRVLVS